ncbi:HAMP domain-containing histidine kinase [Chitinophaga horti]|uniref:histidine kinase n=1 Tax=Chitinophaga horti TaxID=2920382 RepID=A0ABY6J878_9BACT|nr:HAMP domain-containing histidine kinase [Chitinophaga horti]UYQ94777.1 HAMP domain-containing histidine kinase [Chitinophaga horti]
MGVDLLQNLKTWRDRIYGLGVLDTYSKEDGRRIRVVNVIAAVTSILVAIYGIVFFLISRNQIILWPAIACTPMFWGILLLNHKRRYDAARFGLLGIFSFIMLYYGSILSKEADVQVLAIFIISITVLMSKPDGDKLPRGSAMVIPFIFLIVVELGYKYNWGFFGLKAPMTAEVLEMYRWLIIPIVVVLNYLVVSLYQKGIEDLLVTLRNRNNTLRKSRDENQKQKKQLQVNSEKLAEEVKARTAELDRANQSKAIFISELSNEISGPLQGILEVTRQLSDPASGGRITPQQLRSIRANSDELQQLIRNVHHLSEMEEGKATQLHLRPFEIKAWLDDAIRYYSQDARRQSVELLKEIDPRFPSAVITDPDVLGDVIHHVLSNAVKFTEAHKSVRIRGFMNAGKLFIQICDQGTGIAMDKIPSLFRPFDQGDREICRKYGGSGFGLAIAKRQIELLGGDLQISSTLGEGTNFLISWPANVPARVGV